MNALWKYFENIKYDKKYSEKKKMTMTELK